MGKSKQQKKAEKQVKKYYGEKTSDVKTKAATDTQRFQEDLAQVLADSGIKTNRATEDYIRNIGNIETNKAADVADINDYVKTNTGRTQEDLATSLSKETRRYSLESDQVNHTLADQGLTFSERTPEKVARAGNVQNTTDIQTTADRSFQDIARYEATKNRDVELKYGQLGTEAATTKNRTLEDILNTNAKAALDSQRGTSDVAFGKATDIRDINYQQSDSLSGIGNYYDSQKAALKNAQLTVNVKGA